LPTDAFIRPNEETGMTRTKITGLVLGVLAAATAGCESKPPFGLVEGIVTKGGKPIAGVIVDFYPDPGSRGPRSTSEPTDEGGHYQLRSTGGDDGAIVGPHRVCIHAINYEEPDFFDRQPKNAENAKEFQERKRQLRKRASAPPRVPSRYSQ